MPSSRDTIKPNFQTGDVPTQAEFYQWLDLMPFIDELAAYWATYLNAVLLTGFDSSSAAAGPPDATFTVFEALETLTKMVLAKLEADTNFSYKNIYSSAGVPAITPGSGAGTGGTASIVGTNDGGIITLTPGSAPATNAIIVDVLFSNAFAFPSKCAVTLCSANDAAASSALFPIYFYTDGTSTGFTIKSNSINNFMVNGTVYKIAYTVKGW